MGKKRIRTVVFEVEDWETFKEVIDAFAVNALIHGGRIRSIATGNHSEALEVVEEHLCTDCYNRMEDTLTEILTKG